MSGLYGADVAQLRGLAKRFDELAAKLDHDRAQVGEAVRATPWSGPVAVRFRQEWESDHARRMGASASRLRQAASTLRINADDQERTSAVGVGAGASRVAAADEVRDSGPARQGAVVITTPHGDKSITRNDWVDGSGAWQSSESAQGGLNGEASAKAGWQPDGSYRASADASGEAGLSTNTEWSYDGDGVSAGSSYSTFAGARGQAGAGVGLDASGLSADAHGGAFAGSEVSAKGQVDAGGVGAGVGASLRAGVGIDGGVSAKVDADEIKLSANIGVALGIGASLKVNVSVKPAEVVHTVGTFFSGLLGG